MMVSWCWGIVVGFGEGWGGELYRYTQGTLPNYLVQHYPQVRVVAVIMSCCWCGFFCVYF